VGEHFGFWAVVATLVVINAGYTGWALSLPAHEGEPFYFEVDVPDNVTSATNPDDVVARIVVHHFLPDLIGNLKAFSSQQVRCTKCGQKYRRIPLKGRCVECGGNLTLTVHESSVKKYLEVSKKISQQFEVSNYLRQRIDLIEEAITSLFTSDRTQDLKLDDFF